MKINTYLLFEVNIVLLEEIHEINTDDKKEKKIHRKMKIEREKEKGEMGRARRGSAYVETEGAGSTERAVITKLLTLKSCEILSFILYFHLNFNK